MQISKSKLKEELDTSVNPIFLFDDDCDGLCSFLIFWRHIKEGKGFVVKGRPLVDMRYINKVRDNQPDKVFILDIANVEQDFIDETRKLGASVIWVDHHPILERNNAMHYNPRYKNESKPTSQLCYEVVSEESNKDEWLGVTGTVSDWFCNDFVKKYSKEHPELLSPDTEMPEKALYDSKIGFLSRIISFNMKGKLSEVMKAIKVMTRIESPEEILNQTTEGGKFIYKRYEHLNETYQKMLEKAKACDKKDDEILMYIYNDDEWSLTKDLSNELVYLFSEKIVIVGREKDEDVKMSVRSKNYNIQKVVEKALIGIEGYGGGHEHACGANVKKYDFDRFILQFREVLAEQKI